MKLEALKPFTQYDSSIVNALHNDGTIIDFDDEDEVYMKEDVDKALAEKDKEIARQNIEIKEAVKTMKFLEAESIKFKEKLESVQASMYCDVVDANMENRKLKRALWMARAERAKAMSVYWYVKRTEISNWEEFNSKWNKVEALCRTKAEEYK